MAKKDGRYFYLCATERPKTGLLHNKTHFRVIACTVCATERLKKGSSSNKKNHRVTRTYHITQVTARVAQ